MSAVLPGPIQAQVEAAESLMQGNLETPPQPEPLEAAPPAPPAPEPAAPPAAPAAPEPAQDAAYWKQRFDIMQGKYNAEVPRLHETLREQGTAVQQLQTQVSQLSRAPTPAPEPLVTANDEEKFGADLIDAVRRVTREELRQVGSRVDQLEALARSIGQKADRVGSVEQQVALSREQQFYEALKREVPDWEQINVDTGWLKWLAEYSPEAGKVRQQSLDEAAAALDSQRLIAMFNLYKSTVASAPPPPPSQRDQARTELARQVAPSRSSTTSVAPPAEQKFTGSDYQHWLDPRRVRDTDATTLATNLAVLEKALAEGRIDWGR